jgi:nitrate reductase NapAB chaperone NapD
MPIFSYLAIPRDGARELLCSELARIEHCQIIPADNREVIVLVTDTPDESVEKELQKKLKGLQSLHSLSLSFGYNEKV